MTQVRAHGLIALAALALSGCQDPYRHDQPPPARTPPSPASGERERPGPAAPAPPAAASAPRPSAGAAAAAFAHAWTNWDWRNAAARQRALASLATGQLALELRSNAQAAAADASLARDRPGSRGRLVALDLRRGQRRAAAIVVTREQTYSAGRADLGGQHYRVYRALLERTHGGWAVSVWTPLP